MDGRESSFCQFCVDFWDGTAGFVFDQAVVRATEFTMRVADQEDHVAGFLRVHCDRFADVIDLAHRTDQQAGRNRDGLLFVVVIKEAELVVQAVFATNEGRAQRDREVLASDRGTDERPKRFGSIGVAPAEVVEDRNLGRIGSDRDRVPHGFVDRRSGHVIRVEVAVVRVHAATDHQPTTAGQFRTHNGSVAGSIALWADQRFDNAARLDFVIVLANHPVLAGNVVAAQDLEQCFRVGCGVAITDRQRLGLWWFIDRIANHGRTSVVQERHGDVADRLAVEVQLQTAGRNKATDRGGFDAFAFAQFSQFVPAFLWNGQDHSLLSFGNPDLGVSQTVVFERSFVEPNFGTELFTHLANGTAEATRTAIRDRVVQAAIASLHQHVEDHFFGDRVADLNGTAGQRFGFAGQFRTAECRPVDPVSSGASTDRDD